MAVTQNRTTLYVGERLVSLRPWSFTLRAPPDFLSRAGGLDETVTEAVLHAAFLPFGDIKDVSVPVDQGTQKNRGFGFVTFQEADDAAAAMDNMHNAELYGRVLRCNMAQPQKIKGGELGWSTQPVWADADEYQVRLQDERI